MNVLLYSAQPTVRYGGVAGWCREIVAALRGLGHRVHVLTWGTSLPDPARWEPNLHFVQLDPRALRVPVLRFWLPLLAAARTGRRLVQTANIDVIQTVGVYEAWSAVRARGSAGAALVVSIHGDYAWELGQRWKSRWRRRLYRPLERAALSGCQAVTTSSAWLQGRLASEWRARGGVRPQPRTYVVPNGVHLSPDESPVDRRALGLPADRPVVLTLNSLYTGYRRRGVELLIASAPYILAQVPDVLFVVAGGVNDAKRDEALVAWARDRAAGLPFLFTGYRQQPPGDLMSAADLYVHPSYLDNSPTAVLEAMALGKPIVATRVGGIPELVSDGDSGLLVPLEPRALAQAVVRLLQDRPLAQELGARARSRARTDYSWDRVGRQFVELYGESIDGMASGSSSAEGSRPPQEGKE